MKTILLFGAGKSATVLIDYLLKETAQRNWAFYIADANLEIILQKTGGNPAALPVALNINDTYNRQRLIQMADVVISMMPPALHILIAKDCLQFGKHLLTASYLDDAMKALQLQVKDKQLLFLCEMGLDPGIDHMSAMRILHHLQNEGETVVSFKSHCGGLVAPESDNNPWHYKISWNPRNVVLAGSAGADYLLENIATHVPYHQLFHQCQEVSVDGLPPLAWYPNRDSLSYIFIYGLPAAATFIRTTLRYPEFCSAWDAVVKAQLTDPQQLVVHPISFATWSNPIQPWLNVQNSPLFKYLGFFDTASVPTHASTSADVLQYLLETKLVMEPNDQDMIVMLHEIATNNQNIESSLVVKGDDHLRTAMAKTVGLPLGIAAVLLLEGTINTRGVHIPILPEIYEPVLKELENQGIVFKETATRLS